MLGYEVSRKHSEICLQNFPINDEKNMGPSINYVITLEGGGGWEMMMLDDGRGGGVCEMMTSANLSQILKIHKS